MQYSPFSANMNPYQTVYNNGGASAYQPTWGYTDLFGHAFDTSPDLPLGYTRQQYNEERAMAAESMWRSPLLGFGTFATGTLVSHVIFGSPVQNLARLTGGTAGLNAYNAGFSGPVSLGVSRWNALNAHSEARAGIRAGNPDALESARAARQQLGMVNAQIAQYNTNVNTFWGRVGNFSRGVSAFKESVAEATSSLITGGGRVAGSVASAGVRGFGFIAESGINQMTHGAMSPWLERQGANIFEAATDTSNWMGRSARQLQALTSREIALSEATAALRSATTVEEAVAAQARVAAAERNLARFNSRAHGYGSLLTKIRGGAANAVRGVGEILRSGKGISGILGAGVAAGISGVTTLAAPILSNFLNPITSAEFYLMEQVIGYTTDAYQNYQTENEIKRNLMAKGGRILQYGFANGDRGLQGGFSVDQQDRLVSKIRTMATVGASQGDLFGFGADSIFGGHSRYSERMRELKSILSVGTDMGFFDMSRSMDDFEKKFEQTVKTVDKLSKMLKRTKGEIMTVMANVQNTEGLYGMNAINDSVLKKDYAARLTGVDLTTAMQESAAGAHMGRQAGFSAAMGANLMSDSRIMMSNAIRSGDLSREDIFRLGGEQGVITNIQQGYLTAMNDPVLKAELAMGMVRDPVTGKMRFDDTRLRKLATASDAELREMSRERYAFVNTTSYSNIRHASFKGGKMYDAMRYLKTALASGDVSQEQYNMAIAGTVRQKLLAYHINETSPQYQESLRLELENLTGDPATANIIAKQMLGGYAGMQAHNNLVVAADRFREGYEKSGMDFGMLGSVGFSPTHSWTGFGLTAGATALTTAAGAYIGSHFGMAGKGALIGSQIGLWTGKYAAAGLTVAAHELLGANSSVATYLRNSARESAIAQGINPNYVDRYLLGESAADRIAAMGSSDISQIVEYTLRTQKLDDGRTRGSERWNTFVQGSRETLTNSDYVKKVTDKMTYMNNYILAKDAQNSLAGLLRVSSLSKESLEELGIDNDLASKMRELSETIIKGEGTVDMTKLSEAQLRKFAQITAIAQAALPKEQAYEDMVKLKRHTRFTAGTENEEAYQNRSDIINNYYDSGFHDKLGFDRYLTLRGQMGATTKGEADFLDKYLSSDWTGYIGARSDMGKVLTDEKYENSAWYEKVGWAIGIGGFGTRAVGKEQLDYAKTLAEDSAKYSFRTLESLKWAFENIGDERARYIIAESKIMKLGFKHDSIQYKALEKLHSGKELSDNDHLALKSVGNIVDYAFGYRINNKWKERLSSMAASLKHSAEAEDATKGTKALYKLIKSASDDAARNEFTKDDLKALLEDESLAGQVMYGQKSKDAILKEFDEHKDKTLMSIAAMSSTSTIVKQAESEFKEKSESPTGGGGSNIGQISDKAMQNYKDATIMLKEVVTRLGF